MSKWRQRVSNIVTRVFHRLRIRRPATHSPMRRSPPEQIQFETFSVRVYQVVREIVRVVYIEPPREWTFDGERSGPHWRSLDVLVTESLDERDVQRVVGNLALGLQRLGYGYVIRKRTAPVAVPEAERLAALAELQAMGFEQVESPSGVRSSWTTRRGAHPSLEQYKRVPELLRDASEVRETFEVLASAERASSSRADR